MADDDQLRGRLVLSGSGSPAIGTPGTFTTVGGSSSGASGAQTANTDELRVTEEVVEAVSKAPNPTIRITAETVEVVSKNPGVPMRVTQCFVEVVVERDYAGWDTIVIDEPVANPITDVISM
jgi:hypothetical protein